MKIGIVSNSYWEKENYKEGLKKLKKCGYKYYDYQDFISPKSFLYDLKEDEFVSFLNSLKEYGDKLKIKASQVHAVWYAEDDTDEKRKNIFSRYFVKSIIGCRLLGCKYLVVHPIMPCACHKKDDYQEVIDINYNFWTKLLPIAKENGVTLCLENMPFKDQPLNTPQSIFDFVKNINDDNFKICLDTGHVNVFGLDIYENIKAIGELLKVYHIHDNNFGMDLHLFPYQGTVDWKGFIKANKEIKFDGVYSLECCPSKDKIPKAVLQDCQKSLLLVISNIVNEIDKKEE